MIHTVYRWLHARMVLGVALALHLVRQLVVRRRGQADRWLAAMQAEGLGATAPANWPRYEPASRCIGCGWCDQLGDAELPRPSLWMQGAARKPDDALELLTISAALRGKAAAISAICPTGADAGAVADILLQHRAMLPASAARTRADAG